MQKRVEEKTALQKFKIFDYQYVEDVEDVEAKIRPYYKNSPFSGSNYLELKSYPIFFFDQKHTKHIDYTH